VVLDVRRRRASGGREHAWANSLRLQAALRETQIGYRHLPELAPTTELRRLQYREDALVGAGKRDRDRLAPSTCASTRPRSASGSTSRRPAELLPPEGRSALMCVERDAAACHRSLIAARLAEHLGGTVLDLLPAE
jgi:uncharacterized protein (DUF488 family)